MPAVASLLCAIFLLLPGALTAAPQPVHTVAVERQQSYRAQRIFSGRVLGSQRANIGFEEGGVVRAVAVDNGQAVKMGEVLASLDRRALDIEQGELQARQREIAARLGQLQRDLQRFQSLKEKAYVSEGQLEDVKTRLTATQAQLAQVEARLEGVALRLQKSQLRAPFDGEVADLQVEEGVVVTPGQVAMQLVELARSEAVFAISDRLGRNLVIGQPMTVSGDFGSLQATLASVASNLDWRTQTRSIRVMLPVGAPVVDGNTAYLALPEQRQVAGFWLPQQALVEDVRGNWAVYVLQATEAGTELRKRSVQTLYHQGERVYVQGELAPGSQVVREGVHRLVAGQQVESIAQEQAHVPRSQ